MDGYFNDVMVLFVRLYRTISPCLCTRTFSRCSHACLSFLTILLTFVNGNTQSCSHIHRHFKYQNMFRMSCDGSRWRIHTNSRIDHALIDAYIHTDTYRQSIHPHRPYIICHHACTHMKLALTLQSERATTVVITWSRQVW